MEIFWEQIIQKLNQMSDKKIKVIFKLKKGKLKDFKIDLKSLSSNLTDINFDNFELVASGLNDKSFKELE